MRVYAKNDEGGLMFLGDCFDRVPKLGPGDPWSIEVPHPPTVKEPIYTPGAKAEGCFYIRHTYRAGLVTDEQGVRVVAIVINPDSPDPKFLPGWRPDHEGYSLHQTPRRERGMSSL